MTKSLLCPSFKKRQYTKGKNCKVSSLNSLRKLVFQIPDFQVEISFGNEVSRRIPPFIDNLTRIGHVINALAI